MRRTITLISAFMLMLGMLVIPASALPSDHAGTGKVTLCHATASHTNPYVVITIDPAAILRQGHDDHHEDKGDNTTDRPTVFGDHIEHGDRWDDVIPPFSYDRSSVPRSLDQYEGSYPGKNWPADGPTWDEDREGALAILDELCGDAEPPVEPEGQLTVEKTADASFTRTHDWAIDKSVDPDALRLTVDGAGDATVEWDVLVTYLGSEDSDPAVSGVITISNTGDLDAYIDSITDLGELVTDCELDGAPFTIPGTLEPGDEIDCAYSVDLEEFEDGTNSVAVDGVFSDDEPFYEEASAPYEFGDPTTEVNACVNVVDTNEGFALAHGDDEGDVVLCAEDFDAADPDANNSSFTYSDDFAWADYGQDACGRHVIENTAEVLGDEAVQLGVATATLTIDVQCLVFAGETATGEGPQWRNVRGAPNNWFMYTTWADIADDGANLIAGQHHNIGTVTGTRNGTTTLSFTLADGWELADTGGNVKIHPMTCSPNKYIQPGKFSVQATADATSFDVEDLPNTDCYAIHLDVGRWVPDPSF